MWTTRKAEHFARNWKASHPCVDCSEKAGQPVFWPPYVMEFDHVGTKRLTIGYSRQIRRLTEADLRIEIAMCDVVCRNCHAERTHQRLVQRRLAKRENP